MTTTYAAIGNIPLSKKQIWAGIIGNILEHYDSALFALLAPILSKVFFPTFDPIYALILTYAIIPLDILAKPLGALIFGRIGDRVGRKQSLSISIAGTALMTGLIGCVPTWETLGTAAPVLLASVRFMQKMFSAGECVGGAIYILEHQDKKHRNFLSSLYDCSTIIGFLLASTLVTIVCWFDLLESLWRGFFWLGFLTSLIAFYIRMCEDDTNAYTPSKTPKSPLWAAVKQYRWQLLAIVAAAGLNYATFQISLVFMNGFLPLVSKVSASEVYGSNTIMLMLSMISLPFFGMLADRIGATRQMLFACIAIICVGFPLLALCENASMQTLILIRATWVILGVWFCSPFHAWTLSLIPKEHRYTLLSFGYAIGSQVIGAPLTSVSLWIYKSTGIVYAPAIYIVSVACLAFAIIWTMMYRQGYQSEQREFSLISG